MEQVRTGLNNFITVTMRWLPLLLGAILIFIIGWIVASAVRALTKKLLYSIKLNDRLYSAIHGGDAIQRAIPNVSDLIANIVFWVIIFGTISLAVSVLGISALTNFVGAIYGYIPNLIAALLIFIVASAIVAFVNGTVNGVLGDTATGKLIKTVTPFIVLGIATFMILDQLKIATSIITITYAAIMGSAALGLAIAFGFGGRDVASRILESAYQKGVDLSNQAKSDTKMKSGLRKKN